MESMGPCPAPGRRGPRCVGWTLPPAAERIRPLPLLRFFLSNPEMKKGDNEEMKWRMKKPEKNLFRIRVELEAILVLSFVWLICSDDQSCVLAVAIMYSC
jgi:hypothetical protein